MTTNENSNDETELSERTESGHCVRGATDNTSSPGQVAMEASCRTQFIDHACNISPTPSFYSHTKETGNTYQ